MSKEGKVIPSIAPSSLLTNTVVINRAGVVSLGYDNDFRVNGESIIDLARDGVDDLKPKTDYNGLFAAKVCVVIELLGDMSMEVLK